ncbi:MAG: hypothetical protein ACOC3G_01285 [Phycisphaeraceae bacterium]
MSSYPRDFFAMQHPPPAKRRVARGPRPAWAVLASLVLIVASGSAARAVTPVVFVLPDLSEERVRLASLDRGEVAYFNDQGQRVTRPTTELVAILWSPGRETTATTTVTTEPSALISTLFPPQSQSAAEDTAEPTEPAAAIEPSVPDVVELVDGQRWVGRWTGVRDGGLVFRAQSLEIEHVLPIERVVRIGPITTRSEGDDEFVGQDVVTLNNGDRLAGFVAGVTDDAVELIPDGGGDAIPLPQDRIAGLRLANPPEPADPELHTLHLHDGSELLIDQPDTQGDVLAFSLPMEGDETHRLPLSRAKRLDFTAHGRRLLPLTDVERQTISGGACFGVPAPPQTDDGDLLLHAPIHLRYRVDPLARRFATRAVLDLPDGLSDTRRRLVGLRLGLAINGGDTQWWTLDADRPAVDINQAIDPQSARRVSLEIELDPHVNGPVLDRLRIENPRLLLVQPNAGEAGDAARP